MNRLKRLSMAGIMVLALASATFGGNIHTGVVTPPPPPPTQEESVATEPQNSTARGRMAKGLSSLIPRKHLSLNRCLSGMRQANAQ